MSGLLYLNVQTISTFLVHYVHLGLGGDGWGVGRSGGEWGGVVG